MSDGWMYLVAFIFVLMIVGVVAAIMSMLS